MPINLSGFGVGTPPPTPPAQAAAAGYTSLKFYDDFQSISTIDMNDTRNPGFKWYPHNSWSNCTDNLPGNWRVFPPFNTANLNVANSELTITDNTFATTAGLVLMSACDDGAGGHVGFTCPDGWYIEARTKYTEPLGHPNGVCFWVDPIEFMQGQTQDFIEVDILETFNDPEGTSHSGVLNWHYNSNPVTDPGQRSFAVAGFYEHGTTNGVDFSDGNYHTIGCLWKPISLFGSPGSYGFWGDNVEMSRNQSPIPWGLGALQYSTAGVDYGKGEGQHQVLIILSSDDCISQYDWIRVWGRP